MLRQISLHWIFVMCGFGVLAVLLLGGCASGSRGGGVEIRAGDLMLRYDSVRDRVVSVGPVAGPNLLEVRELEVLPSADGAYRFYGGLYTWIAPQNGWRDAAGELSTWPPDPAMDRGPGTVVGKGENWLEVVGPRTRAGFVQRKRITIINERTIEIAHQLKNESATPQSAAIWSNSAVPPGGVIAVRMAEEGLFDLGPDYRLNDPEALALLELVSRKVGRWRLLDTQPNQPISEQPTDSFKLFFETMERTEIATWINGYWLIRSSEQNDIFQSLVAVGEASVEVYANYGLNLFEAELLSPLQTIAPGGVIEFTERWQIVRSGVAADVSVLDELIRD